MLGIPKLKLKCFFVNGSPNGIIGEFQGYMVNSLLCGKSVAYICICKFLLNVSSDSSLEDCYLYVILCEV